MSIDKTQLRNLIRNVLRYLEPEIPYSENAVELLMLTAAQESHLRTHIRQINGPARGIFQMEPATERDIYLNHLAYHPALAKKIADLKWSAKIDNLEANLAYQIAMARVHYYRVAEALPEKDYLMMAVYYKKYYNTSKGKATIQEAVNNYKRYCV